MNPNKKGNRKPPMHANKQYQNQFNNTNNINPNQNQPKSNHPSRPPMNQPFQQQRQPFPQQTYFQGQNLLGQQFNQYPQNIGGLIPNMGNFLPPFQVPNQGMQNPLNQQMNAGNQGNSGRRPPMAHGNQQMFNVMQPQQQQQQQQQPQQQPMQQQQQQPISSQSHINNVEQQQQHKPYKAPMTGSNKQQIPVQMNNNNIINNNINDNINKNDEKIDINDKESGKKPPIASSNKQINNNNSPKKNNNNIVNKNNKVLTSNNNDNNNNNNDSPVNKKKGKPWIQFTGEDKKPEKGCVGWAYRVRAVWSADRLQLALKKSSQCGYKKSNNRLINFTLEGLKTPKVQTGRIQKETLDEDGKPKKVEEAFGFEAREFVRQKIMNIPVFYVGWFGVGNNKPNFDRIYGDIYYKNSEDKWESLSEEIVAAGYAQLKGSRPSFSEKELKRLTKALNNAKNLKKGQWKIDKLTENDEKLLTRSVKQINRNDKQGPRDYKNLLKKYKGQILLGIVDQVISGSTLRIELLLNYDVNNISNNKEFKGNNEHIVFVTSLVGCNAPRTAFVNPNKQNASFKGDPFGEEAKEFVEERLLHQYVKIKMVTDDPQGNIYSIVKHAKGDIAPALLKMGFAEYVSWTAKACDDKYKKLLNDSAKLAQQAKKGRYSDNKNITMDKSEEALIATVTKVISGDTVECEIHSNNNELKEDNNNNNNNNINKKQKKRKRFTLSSIQAKPMPNIYDNINEKKISEKEKKRILTDNYWAREAKEFLRNKLIGKKVMLYIEYERKSNDPKIYEQYGKQEFVTIISGKENVAISLVKEGLATVFEHGKYDKRSEDYQKLIEAQQSAKSKKLGLHNTKAKLKNVIDYSTGKLNIKASDRIQLVQNIKGRQVDGVIEHVFNGNRLKVFLPKQSCYIPLMLAGIRSSDPNRLGNYSDINNQKCKEYLTKLLYQKSVKVQIDECTSNQAEISRINKINKKKKKKSKKDAKGNEIEKQIPPPPPSFRFTGQIFINDNNITEELLRQGLAKIFRIPPRFRENNAEEHIPQHWYAIEKKAKDEQKGLWKFDSDNNSYNNRTASLNDELTNELKEEKDNKTGTFINSIISHIESASSFFINKSDSNEFEKLEQEMNKLKDVAKKPRKLKPGKYYAAWYDGGYARAKINMEDDRNKSNKNEKKDDNNEYKSNVKKFFVIFVDYGNRASIDARQFAVLPAELRIDRIPKLALRCELGGIQPARRDSAYFAKAGETFANMVLERTLKVNILYHDIKREKFYVDIIDDNDTSISCELARMGIVKQASPNDRGMSRLKALSSRYNPEINDEKDKNYKINKHYKYINDYLTNLEQAFKEAQVNHIGMFQYSSTLNDEDDE